MQFLPKIARCVVQLCGLLNILRSDTICSIIHNLFGPEGAEVRPTIEAAIGGSDVSIEQGLVFVEEDSDEDGGGGRV